MFCSGSSMIAGFTDTRNMSCAEIEQCIGNGFREYYAADPAVLPKNCSKTPEGALTLAVARSCGSWRRSIPKMVTKLLLCLL
jgi:hypothetical protein